MLTKIECTKIRKVKFNTILYYVRVVTKFPAEDLFEDIQI